MCWDELAFHNTYIVHIMVLVGVSYTLSVWQEDGTYIELILALKKEWEGLFLISLCLVFDDWVIGLTEAIL